MSSAAARSGQFAHVAWGVGSLGTITYINTVAAVGLVFLTTVLGIEPGIAGTMMTAARLFDAFSDPAMGYITDRTRSKLGRRRPWLLLGSLVCGIALPAFYAVPRLGDEQATIALAMLALLVYSLGFTIFNVPYMTMPIEMSRDHQQRVGIMSWRVIFMSIGSFLGGYFAPWTLELLGKDARGFAGFGAIFGAVVLTSMLITFFGTARVPLSTFQAPHLSIREQIRTALDNRPFALLMGVKVLQFIGIAAHTSTLAYFATTVLKRDFNVMLIYGVGFLISTVLCVRFVWRPWSQRLPKRTGFIIGVLGYIALTLTWLAASPTEPEILVPVRAVVMGFFTSAILLFGQAVWVDAVDYDYRRTGLRREGLFTSVYVFVERLGYSLGPFLLGWLLQWFKYDKSLPLDQQPESASLGVMASLVGVPALSFALSLIFLWKYDLTEAKLDATRPQGVAP
jgi:glycoside/pentoside/hexuronide:cation symporter, GPH family